MSHNSFNFSDDWGVMLLFAIMSGIYIWWGTNVWKRSYPARPDVFDYESWQPGLYQALVRIGGLCLFIAGLCPLILLILLFFPNLNPFNLPDKILLSRFWLLPAWAELFFIGFTLDGITNGRMGKEIYDQPTQPQRRNIILTSVIGNSFLILLTLLFMLLL